MSLHPTASLLSLAAAITLLVFPAGAQPANGITREVYSNIGGSSISDLTNNAAFPNFPTIEAVLTNSMDCPVDFMENYGTRLRALVVPPATGAYTFWIASDDQSVLYLSTDATPANKVLIARVNAWTSWKEWGKETNQQSAPITLNGGQHYYLEALQKEGNGGDSLTVRWQLPSGTIEEPLPAARCIPVGVTAPLLTQQPTNVTVIEGNQAIFAVRFTRSFGASIQWKRFGTNIPGATETNYVFGPVTLADNGSPFSCLVVNPYGGSPTTNAVLTVVPDTTPPTISSVGNLGDNDIITVVFSEAVESASATATANYAINNGVSVLNATFGVDARTIVLTTTPLAANVNYTLTVNNVRDRAATPNTIPANTQRTFSRNARPLDISFLKPGPELPGPSTRRGPLVISEVMYHPTNRTDLRNIEFIEIYNSNPWFEEMGGFRISGAIEYTFPNNFVLGARSYVVVAANPSDVQAVYGISGVQGPWVGALENSDGTLQIRNTAGAVMFDMEYTGEPPFPAAADGTGHSLVLARPSYGEGDARAWAASDLIGGTPGTNEVAGSNPYRTVMINEFLAHTDLPNLDYIELFNYSAQAVNLGNCVLTDDPSTNKFIIPPGTFIPTNGFVVFYETNLGFALSAEGETIYLKNPQRTRVLDAVRFEAQENGIATGRSPDGAKSFSRLQNSTPGTNNARVRTPVVVINEIMYDPVSNDGDDEFVELFNPANISVNISKWRLKDAVKFTIPNNTILPPKGYLVIAAKAARLRANYPSLNIVNCMGDWEGTLRNRGERIALTMPDTIVSTNGLGALVTNTIHIVMDEVTYADGGRWGKYSAGGGSSLELRDWHANRRLAPNWGDSDESAKQGWINVEATGTMDHGYEQATQLHVTLMGAGEALIDNIEVTAANWVTNIIGNGTFESGTSGWVFQGNHSQTSWETTDGFSSSRSLHLRATGRGDTGANRTRTQLPFTLANGTTNVTLRAKVRWLKGRPNLLLRLRGNYHEAPGFTLTAKNLGTPGMANSIVTTNAGPAITDVSHWPALPAVNQQVLVTARAEDPDGLASMLLKYRIDPATNFTTASMTNNGAGIFSAVIPGQASAAMAVFHIQASDKLSPAIAASFPDDAPNRECIVRWGDTTVPGNGGMGTYRFWLSQKTVDQWSTEEKMSNKPKDVTYIYGTNRIVYNAGAWFHGSPYHSPSYNSPVGNSCDYDMGFPPDDRLYGETDINLFRPGNGGGDGTGQTEIHAYWFGREFGVPYLYHRPVFLYVNGVLRNAVYHDAQQPNSDFVEQWFPDNAEGELHKIQLGFEFGDTAYGAGEAGYTAIGANLGRYLTTGGAFKMARYRQTWPRRGSAPQEFSDYTNIFNLVNATLTTAPLNSDAYTTVLTNFFDVREWYRVHVTQHLINNNDSYSYGGGQNAFAYKPLDETWRLLLWDVDFAFGGNGSDANLFNIGGADHGPRNDHAPFARIYWQTLMEAANGMLLPSRSDSILDARYNGMVASGASVGSPANIKTFIQQKRSVITSLVASNNTSPFEIQTSGGNDFSTSNNLVTLNGRAPFGVASIEVNGIAYAVTWTTLSNWTLRVALPPGSNTLSVIGYDVFGNAVASSTDSIRVNVVAPLAPPQDFIVINEVMFHPRVADAEYVELFNTSTNISFNMSGWRLDGIDYIFPEGTIMPPRAFFVLAKNLAAFTTAYGTNVSPFGIFAGNLQSNGETLTLVQPGLTAATDVIIDKLRYEGAAPWSTNANATGSSFQLIDARQDNSRPGNWLSIYREAVYSAGGFTPERTNDGWRFFSATGTISSTNSAQRLVFFLGESGSALLDDISVVTGTNPAVGFNHVRNGDFESPLLDGTPLTNSWFLGTNYTSSLIVDDLVHSGSGALKIIGTSPGSSANPFNKVIYQFLDPVPSIRTNTLSFWYWATNSATNLYSRIINSTGITTSTNPPNGPTNIHIFITPSNYTAPVLISAGTNSLTPGNANTGVANMTPIPPLWLNEVQADNLNGILDNAGQREPWVELYNAGTNTLTLTNLFLSHNYTNLTHSAFPANATIGAGQFLIVFCDGQPAQSTSIEPHTSFRLPSGLGSIALSRMWNGQTQVLDYLNYNAGIDHSYGAFPDGQLFARQEFFHVTPAGTNNGTLPPVNVFINEWLADNIGTIADPADNNYEDWIELYNASSDAVSLGGYFLTDELTNKFKFEIPPGFSIPPHGYLLVWADSESAQNAAATGDLHVNFGLAKGGEQIGLFTPDGIQIDAVTFGAQINDVSRGRFPDGSASFYFMTNTYTPRAANFVPLPNVAPVLASIANRTMFEGEPLSFTATATDSNSPAQTLDWNLQPGAPAGAVINSSNGIFGWVPSEAQGGQSFPITVRVTDNGTPPLSDTKSFTVEVLKTNSAPTLSIGGGRVVGESNTISFIATGGDGDVPPQVLTFSLDPTGLPAGASINSSDGMFSWQPDEAQGPGVYTITIRVTDNGVPPLSKTELVTLIVDEINISPVLSAITNRTVALGETVSFTVQASDVDLPAQLLTFDFTNSVPGASVNATNGNFSWMANVVGTNTFAVRVADNGPGALSDTQTFEIIVTGSQLMTTIGISNQLVTLNWNAISNRAYDVEFKHDLSDLNWTPLVTNIVATGDNASATDAIGTNSQRVYRILLQP